MSDDSLRSRRGILGSAVRVAGGVVALVMLPECKKESRPFTCTDGVSKADQADRATVAYLESGSDPARVCTKCQQFVAAAEGDDACGTCKVLHGPIHPRATCKVFVAKS